MSLRLLMNTTTARHTFEEKAKNIFPIILLLSIKKIKMYPGVLVIVMVEGDLYAERVF